MKRVLSFAAMIVLAVTVAAAQGYGHGPHGPGEPGMNLADHLTKMLDLTPDQTSKVQAIVSKYTDGSMGEKMRSMQEAQSTLHRTVHNPDATDAQVQQAVGVVSGIQGQLALEQHHMAVEVGTVLTADQKAKFQQMMSEHREHDGPPPMQGGGF
ncbi:MAG TPA: periplasmic heavy metal sensor [Candidatus Polarisedimenticolaceae bacterium]|nr:periplasmic heavy metal sensor [Candidatus Polarisedimenticolaceae bacterium]